MAYKIDDALIDRMQNILDYNNRGTKHIITDIEIVPHDISYRDYPYFKLFNEYYCIVTNTSAFYKHNEYVQFTHDISTNDLYYQSIGRL